MELIWLVLALLVVDLAAILFAADTRPGLEHSSRPLTARRPQTLRLGTLRGGTSRPGTSRPGTSRLGTSRFIGG
jgi:hypothetical protein